MFSVGVTINAIEPYDQYNNLPDADKTKFLDDFLNTVAAGIIREGKQHLISGTNRQVGKLLIKEVVFSDRDPTLRGSQKWYLYLQLLVSK